MSKLVRAMVFAIAVVMIGGEPSSAAGGAGDVKGVGGGWASFPPATSAKFWHFSFSAHTGPKGDFGQIQFQISDEFSAPLDVSATVDCLNTFAEPTVRGVGWFSGIVTRVDPVPNLYSIAPGDRMYFQIVDGGDPSERPVDDFQPYTDIGVSCKDLPAVFGPRDVTQGNILISTN
jgi:hypothetical protein